MQLPPLAPLKGMLSPEYDPIGPSVTDVELIPAVIFVTEVELVGVKQTTPSTSQSPAVRLIDAMFWVVPLLRETGVLELLWHPVGEPPFVTWAQTYSPTLPAFALLFVVVPAMPAVCDGVMMPLAAIVVNDPALPPPVTAFCANAVVAICVVLVPALAVGAVGVPLSAGDAIGA